MDIRLHRAEWQVQNFGDLLVGPALDMAQEDAGAGLWSERSDRRLDCSTELLGLHRIERRFLSRPDLESSGLHGFGSLCVRRTVQGECVQLPPTQVIDGGIVGDLKDPGGELELRS